jgi:hypothetical protein
MGLSVTYRRQLRAPHRAGPSTPAAYSAHKIAIDRNASRTH